MTDLTFLIDREKAMKVKEEIVDEMESWNGILDTDSMNMYLLMIHQLNEIIDRLNK